MSRTPGIILSARINGGANPLGLIAENGAGAVGNLPYCLNDCTPYK